MQGVVVRRFGVMRRFEFVEIGVAERVEPRASRRRTQLACVWQQTANGLACVWLKRTAM
jgi:hypothetical protein